MIIALGMASGDATESPKDNPKMRRDFMMYAMIDVSKAIGMVLPDAVEDGKSQKVDGLYCFEGGFLNRLRRSTRQNAVVMMPQSISIVCYTESC